MIENLRLQCRFRQIRQTPWLSRLSLFQILLRLVHRLEYRIWFGS